MEKTTSSRAARTWISQYVRRAGSQIKQSRISSRNSGDSPTTNSMANALRAVERTLKKNMKPKAEILTSVISVNRTRNGTCVNRVVLELWKEQSMY
jgi:hypothetical protein